MKYLLDTNVISEPLTKKPNPRVLHKLAQHQAELVTAAPVWHELIFGMSRLAPSRKKRDLSAYLSEVVAATILVLPYDTAAANWHGNERARLTKKGKTPAFVDGQIAAIANRNDLILVTRNVADFRPFQNVTIDNWFE